MREQTSSSGTDTSLRYSSKECVMTVVMEGLCRMLHTLAAQVNSTDALTDIGTGS
jgi:hypothetical protein